MTRHLMMPLALLSLACADDPEVPVATGTGLPAAASDTQEDTATLAQAASLSVDATDEAAWTHLDLATGDVVEAGWTLAFQRATIKINGGVSGDGGVMAQLVDAPLSTDMEVPEDGWKDDTTGDDGTALWAFDGWYIYDSTNHTLSPTPGTWLVKQADGAVFGVVIDSYYDEHGTSAVYQLTTLSLRAAE